MNTQESTMPKKANTPVAAKATRRAKPARPVDAAAVRAASAAITYAGDDAVKATLPGSNGEISVDPKNPLLFERVLYPNRARLTEAKRLAAEAAKKPPVDAKADLERQIKGAKQLPAAKAKHLSPTRAKKLETKAKADPTSHAATVVAARQPKASPKHATVKVEGEGKVTKSDIVLGMMRREVGATAPELMTATGWQAHSLRGYIAGTVKRKMGLQVESTRNDGVTTYRIPAAKASKKSAPLSAAELA